MSGCTNISIIEIIERSFACQIRNALSSVTQHYIFESALTSHDEDSSDSFGNLELRTIK
jgi:hypothetical protein